MCINFIMLSNESISLIPAENSMSSIQELIFFSYKFLIYSFFNSVKYLF